MCVAGDELVSDWGNSDCVDRTITYEAGQVSAGLKVPEPQRVIG
jgi:hypothetical protein